MPSSNEMAAPVLSTAQDETTFSYAKVDHQEVKRLHLPHGVDLDTALREYYSLDELAAVLREKKYTRVTLQFPDELICDSAAVAQYLQRKLGLWGDDETKSTSGRRSADVEPPAKSSGCSGSSCTGSGCSAPSCSDSGCSDSGCSGPSCSGPSCSPASDSAKQRLWILADTSYSACCVDEVAAEHVNADLVVHFGDACLNPVASIAAMYVFGRAQLDMEHLVAQFEERYSAGADVVLMADAPHTHLLQALQARLPHHNTVVADLHVQDSSHIVGYTPGQAEAGQLTTLNRVFPISEDTEDDIGGENIGAALMDYDLFHLTVPEAPRMLQLTTKFASVTTYDPTLRQMSQGPFPNLMRRYRYMHLARAAGTVGILVNTLSLAHTRSLMEGMARKIKEAGKKHYLFVVGKPNVAKLANFDAIDMWCVLGCDHQGIILDQTSQYYKPIVTPYELLLALSDELTWTGKWVTDFRAVLHGLGSADAQEPQPSTGAAASPDSGSEDEAPEFNSVTGQYVSNARPLRRLRHLQISLEEDSTDGSNGALVKKLSSAVAIRGTYSSSAAHLQTREWTGLGSDWTDQLTEGAEVEEGGSGIARGYEFDRENKKSL